MAAAAPAAQVAPPGLLRRLWNSLGALRIAALSGTVAALAFALRQQFSPLAETWWMHLVRVVVVKIQVISSSADKCIRVMVASCPDQRLLVQIMESCTAKAPPLRKLGL
eukprot:gene46706-58236_t